MADTRGIFLLSEIFEDIREGDGVDVKDVFIIPESGTSTNCGYYGGGNPGSRSTMDKLNYADDTTAAVPGGALSAGRYGLAATGSQTAGYFSGGFANGTTPHSTTDRITYSTDTTAHVPGADLSIGIRYYLGATGNITAGYYGGGQPGNKTTMEKLSYASETFAQIPSGALSTPGRNKPGAVANSTHGYFGGGMAYPAYFSTMDKFAFSNDTTARVPTADLSTERGGFGGVTGNSTHGYFGGGLTPTYRSTMDKLEYSGDTVSEIPGAALSSARAYGAATGNSTTSGYFGGGATAPFETMDKTNFTDDTTAHVPGADLSIGRSYIAAAGPRSNALPSAITFPVRQWTTGITPQPNIGYSMGGTVPAYTNKINKFDMSTETATNPGSTLPQPQGYAGNAGNRTKSYLFGGTHSSSPYVFADCYTVTYSTDAAGALPGANLTAARYGPTSTSSADAAYTAGGKTPSTVSRMDKMTYSDETTAQVTTGSLSRVDYYMSSHGDQERGYYGATADVTSNYDRMQYSSDTTVNVPSFTLSFPQRGNSAVTGDGFAFISSGPAGTNTYVERADYSTETIATTPSASLVKDQNKYMFTFSNNDSGYFAGGDGPTQSTSIDKLTYSTSTTSTVPAQLVTGASTTQGSSPRKYNTPQVLLPTPTPQEYGELVGFDGGYYIGDGSAVEKMNFTTDTSSRTSNDLVGTVYLGGTPGGFSGPTGSYTISGFNTHIQKVTYTNDTTSIIPTEMSAVVYNRAGFMSFTHGYLGGGGPGPISTVDKFAFSDETRSVTNPMTIARQDVYSVGNSTQGYFMGSNPRTSTVSKYTFSTDTDATLPANLPEQSGKGCGAGNADIAYVNTGRNPSDPSTVMFKLTYSTDTISSAPDIAASHYTGGGCSNSTAAYFMAGGIPSSPSTSNIHKITFATGAYETLNPMSEAQRRGTGTGPRSNDFSSPAPVIC